MKASIHLATEQFCYIEFDFEGTAEEVIAEEKRLQNLYKGGPGLEQKEWNRILDNYLWGTGTMLSEEYEAMNLEQQTMVQTIKRSRKRKDYKPTE